MRYMKLLQKKLRWHHRVTPDLTLFPWDKQLLPLPRKKKKKKEVSHLTFFSQ